MILDQPWQLELFHLQQLRYALRIEIDEGIRSPGGTITLRAANKVLLRNGVISRPFRTQRFALRALEGYITKKEQEAMGSP